ncbi:hypothetical protein [Jiangella alba]|uniref:Uncharacterized protein n=1 Tax=Jiangella alba TaxID=561176 RepID=A0A1H5PKY6_9ACTN|nr:hypothetical protein [Jiangella alba]SEF14416.1 hypothetical protein SAMN04488561_4631 [Jiangella alba]
MTLLTVFLRRVLSHYELVIASDSRLSGGQALDHAQKVFQLGRSDALIAFAGDTQWAYPLLMQMQRAIENYPFSSSRRLPLSKLKGHTLRVFQQTYDAIHSLPVGQRHPDKPDNYFLLGGYDWQDDKFKAWRLAFDAGNRRFIFRRLLGANESKFFFSGDNKQAVVDAIRRTRVLLRERDRDGNNIDMEPFEILCEITGDERYPGIGGVPQIGKVYKHLNTQLFQLMWSCNGVSTPHFAGRPLQQGERNSLPIFDPAKGFYSVREMTALED